jgi:hypothetical protein
MIAAAAVVAVMVVWAVLLLAGQRCLWLLLQHSPNDTL